MVKKPTSRLTSLCCSKSAKEWLRLPASQFGGNPTSCVKAILILKDRDAIVCNMTLSIFLALCQVFRSRWQIAYGFLGEYGLCHFWGVILKGLESSATNSITEGKHGSQANRKDDRNGAWRAAMTDPTHLRVLAFVFAGVMLVAGWYLIEAGNQPSVSVAPIPKTPLLPAPPPASPNVQAAPIPAPTPNNLHVTYKCQKSGRTSFSDKPCAAGESTRTVPPHASA